MKNFANCSADAFMMQIVKFRAPFKAWCDEIGLPEIRARRPEGFDDMTQEEKAKAITRIGAENMGEILTIALEKQPEATKDLLCLATFTDRKDFGKHTMVEYLAAIMEMMQSQEVRGFFTFYLAASSRTSTKG